MNFIICRIQCRNWWLSIHQTSRESDSPSEMESNNNRSWPFPVMPCHSLRGHAQIYILISSFPMTTYFNSLYFWKWTKTNPNVETDVSASTKRVGSPTLGVRWKAITIGLGHFLSCHATHSEHMHKCAFWLDLFQWQLIFLKVDQDQPHENVKTSHHWYQVVSYIVRKF